MEKKKLLFGKELADLYGQVETLTGQVSALTEERDNLQAASTEMAAQVEKTEGLEAKVTELTGKLEAAETAKSEALAAAAPEKVQAAAQEQAIEIAANAGVPPIQKPAPSAENGDGAPKNKADFYATHANLKGSEADAYWAKHASKFRG